MTDIYIKNMVCNRCIIVVKQELEKLHLTANTLVLGHLTLKEKLSVKQLNQLKQNLVSVGFEVLDDLNKKLIEKIKNTIIEQIHYQPVDESHNFSAILTNKLHKDYSHLSSLFSTIEGITIEKFVIHQKIEKAKELITYKEMNFNEIALQLGYSSSAHLSAQFKKVTGLTPTHFKNIAEKKRISLDAI